MKYSFLCTLIALLISDSAQAVQPSSFLKACASQAPSPSLVATVSAITKLAGSNDCKVADKWLTNQTSLNLSSQSIQDLSPLAHLTHLTRLWLNQNQIQDVTDLATLDNLEMLSLIDNGLWDVRPLKELKRLKILNLGQNRLVPNQISEIRNALSSALLESAGQQTLQSSCEDPNLLPADKAFLALLMKGLHVSNCQDLSKTPDLLHQTKDDQFYLRSPIAPNQPEFEISFNFLRYYPKLKTFQLHPSDLPDFQGPYPHHHGHVDLSPLLDLPLLTDLGLDGVWVQDFSILNQLPNLVELTIRETEFSPDYIRNLSQLKNIEQLNLYYEGFSELSFLSNMKKLRHLGLMNNSPLASLDSLPELPALTAISTIGIPVADLEFVRRFPNLTILDLYGAKVKDLAPVATLTQLKRLTTDGEISDLSPLTGLKSLEYLDLNENQISDISKLEELPQLQHLELRNNPVTQINALAKLTALTDLFLLKSDKISDWAPLLILKKLKNVYLPASAAPNAQALAQNNPGATICWDQGEGVQCLK